MARVILPALAVIAAVLGYLMDNTLLLGLAGGFFVIALLVLGVLAVKRQRRRASSARSKEAAASREEELRAVGISDIRPRGASGPASPVEREPDEPAKAVGPGAEEPVGEDAPGIEDVDSEPAPVEETDAETVKPNPEPPSRAEAVKKAAKPSRRGSEPFPMYEAREDSPFWRMHSPTAVNSYLRALWASTDVKTVALFSSDEGSETYTLESALSHSPHIRREGRFPAADHLLDAISTDRTLTALEAHDPLVRTLPYYKQQVPVGGVAVLPLRGG
jgi:hypothetical protein